MEENEQGVSEMDVFISYIQQNYGNLDIDFVVAAFEAYCADALRDYGAPNECYFFSYHFFSRVIRSYYEYLKSRGGIVSSFDAQRQIKYDTQKKLEYKPEPVDWSVFLNIPHKSTVTIPVQLYDHLVSIGQISKDDYKKEIEWVIRIFAAKIEGVFRKTSKDKQEEISKLTEDAPLVIIEAKKRFVLNYINSQ